MVDLDSRGGLSWSYLEYQHI